MTSLPVSKAKASACLKYSTLSTSMHVNICWRIELKQWVSQRTLKKLANLISLQALVFAFGKKIVSIYERF